MAEKNSLWKNIRNKAKQNKRTGATPKKPTAEMIRQERKIKAQHAEGGYVYGDGGQYLTADGIAHRVYRNVDGDIMVNHPKNDYGKSDTLNLTNKSDANTIAEGVASVRKWHRENPSYAQGGYMYNVGGPFNSNMGILEEDPYASSLNQGAIVGKPAQEWLNNWVQDPEFTRRMNKIFPNKPSDFKKAVQGSRTANRNNREANVEAIESRIPKLVTDINNSKFLYNENTDVNQSLLNSYLGTLNKSDRAYVQDELKKNPQGFTDTNDNIIIANPNGYSPESVALHELIHKNTFKTNDGSERLSDLFLNKISNPPTEKMDADFDQSEVYPFIMQMRYDNQFEPGEEITPERIKQIRESGPKNHLFKYYDDTKISKYLNTLASNQTQAPMQYAARGGYMYDNGGGVGEDGKPIKISKKTQYDVLGGDEVNYISSDDNKYYADSNTPQGVDYESKLPEFEFIEDTGYFNPNEIGPTAPRYLPSETGFVQNPNWRGGDAIDPSYPEMIMLPGNLPIKAASRLGKVGVGLLEAAIDNPGLNIGSSLKELGKKATTTALTSKPAEMVRKEILKKVKENSTNAKGSLFDKKNLDRLQRTNYVRSGDASIHDHSGYSLYDPVYGSLYDSKAGSGELRKHFSKLYGKQNSSNRYYNFRKGNFSSTVKLPKGDEAGSLSSFTFMDNNKISAGRTAKFLEDLSENIPGKWEFNPGSISGDSYPMWMNLIKRKKDLEKFEIDINPNARGLNGLGQFSTLSQAMRQGNNADVQRLIPEHFNPVFDRYGVSSDAKNYFTNLLNNNPGGTYHPDITLIKKKADGGYINPYMYYSDDSMEYGRGGNFLKHLGAGAYSVGEGMLDTITMGATDQLTDKGFEGLTKLGNKNMDLNDPANAKFLKTQQQIKGYGNTAAAVATGIATGNVQGAVTQGAKGLNTAFQASDWATDDFKKWSGISSQAIGIGAGLAGGSLNTTGTSASASEAAGKVGEISGKVSPYVNQAVGMFGSNQQPMWQQAQAQQDLLNSPEYAAQQSLNNQQYVNQGLSFSHGGNITNNSLNLQSMKGRYQNYKQRMSSGGTFNQYGIDFIPESAGLHHQNAYGGVTIGSNAKAEGGEINMDTPDGGQYIVSDQVDGAESQMDFTFSKGGKYKELNRTLADGMKQDLSKYSMGSLATNSSSKEDVRRPMDSYSKSTIDQIKQKWQQKTEFARQRSQQEQAIAQAEDQKRLIEEEYIAAYGGKINPKKYPGLNRSKKSKGGYVYNAMTQPMLAQGGPVVSNVQQPFNGPAAQNRGGMMMADGGMIPQEQQMMQQQMMQDQMMQQQQMQQQGGQDQMMQVVQQVAEAIMGGADPRKIMQDLMKSGMPEEQVQQVVQVAMQEVEGQQQGMQGQQMAPEQGMAMGGAMYAPGGFLDNFRSDFNHGRRMAFNKPYRNAYNLAKGYNTINPKNYPNVFTEGNGQVGGEDNAGLYPMTQPEATQYQGYDPTKVTPSSSTKGGLPTGNENVFGNDKLGKGLAIGQAAIPLAEAAYHMFNKPKYLNAPVVNAATVDYTGARTTDQRQTDMTENSYLDKLRNSAGTSGMFANNAKEFLLKSNEDQAARTRASIEGQMNFNSQEEAKAAAATAQYRFNTDQLNTEMDQARLGNIFGSLNNAATTGMQGYNDVANRKIQEMQARSTESSNVVPITIDGKVYQATKQPDGYYYNGKKIAEIG